MAVALAIQNLEEGPRNVSFSISALGDGNGQVSNYLLVNAKTLSPPSPSPRVERINGAVDYGVIQLWWDAEIPVKIADLAGQITLDYSRIGGLTNPKAPGWTGNILLTTIGFELNSASTLLLELVK